MGKRLSDPKEKIVQRSVGFKLRQITFFADYPEFRPDEFCRNAVDKQIEIINPEFLPNEKKTE